MNDLLNIQNLSKHYDGFDLTDISLSVPAGGVVGFIGSNGAGKTTTIKTVLGITEPDSGNVTLFGEEAGAHTAPKQLAKLKQRIGVVFDTCPLPDEITVGTAGVLMSHAYPSWDARLFDAHCAAFNLPPKKLVKDLSRGMGMKLSLACALSHNPDLLILDESTAGLDPIARDEVLDVLRDFMTCENHGILMSSHITSDLEKIADYIVCIDNGRIAFSLEKDAITDTAGIAHCRTADFEQLAASGFFAPGTLRYQQHTYGTSVLVPDRFAFAKRFCNVTLDKATIDTYMGITLKGETL